MIEIEKTREILGNPSTAGGGGRRTGGQLPACGLRAQKRCQLELLGIPGTRAKRTSALLRGFDIEESRHYFTSNLRGATLASRDGFKGFY